MDFAIQELGVPIKCLGNSMLMPNGTKIWMCNLLLLGLIDCAWHFCLRITTRLVNIMINLNILEVLKSWKEIKEWSWKSFLTSLIIFFKWHRKASPPFYSIICLFCIQLAHLAFFVCVCVCVCVCSFANIKTLKFETHSCIFVPRLSKVTNTWAPH